VRDRNLEIARFHESESGWLRSFAVHHVKCLVVCRGPVRKEAFEVFEEIGMREYGMLLSEKDSVTYPRCVAPELRDFRFPHNVHRVADYMGAGQEEKLERIEEIIQIALAHGYTHIFAGYGFMAEDAEFIEAIEKAGVGFIGPSSGVVRRAGAKDEAKKLARALGNAVIPGVDDVSSRTLAARVGNRKALESLAAEQGLAFSFDAELSLEENAEALLQAGYAASVELVTIEELQARAEIECRRIWDEYPSNRIRFKHIGGGGGKGQRVVAKPAEVAAAVMAVLAESKVVTPGSNRNFLIELNIESTRHNEIQLVGNGEWCVSLGGRDCSVQMHEQKLLEVSLTQELLDVEVGIASGAAAEKLRGDKGTLERMETEGARFGQATGLDSVSTFECIVEGFNHFFMEMNTRIQVEHGVTEHVYRLKFTNPDDPAECFHVDRLIEAMVLLAVHGPRLPEPERLPRAVSGIEVRINATNQALQPHAGGLIRTWSPPREGEGRYDQGIGTRNPDTGAFVYYNLAGAYDSNIALMLIDGENRRDNLERTADILRRTELRGEDLQTNLPVHYGLVNWFLGKAPMALPDTRFMQSWLAGVGSLQQLIDDVDLELAASEILGKLPDAEARQVFAAKETLLVRPIRRLLADPHVLAGFLGRFDGVFWHGEGGAIDFSDNPIRFLHELCPRVLRAGGGAHGSLRLARDRCAARGRARRPAGGRGRLPLAGLPGVPPRVPARARAPAAHPAHRLRVRLLRDRCRRAPDRRLPRALRGSRRGRRGGEGPGPRADRERRRDRDPDGRHLLRPRGAAPTAAGRGRRALRGGAAALHHRGDEDVQQDPRALRRYGRREHDERERRHRGSQGSGHLQDRARRTHRGGE
jgi:acetyl/propionyl-CoA carboxylase alpha subunit